jgi:hypothetical protein
MEFSGPLQSYSGIALSHLLHHNICNRDMFYLLLCRKLIFYGH